MVKPLKSDEGTTAGLPRRAAMQGIAGSLAGIAALGAVGASAKKKNKKKSTKGTLVRVEIVEVTGQVPGSSVGPVEAICDAPGSKENVFVLGGGFKHDPATSDDYVIKSSFPTTSGGEQGGRSKLRTKTRRPWMLPPSPSAATSARSSGGGRSPTG